MIGPRTAVSASRADITRWNTSCCGIDPIMIVIAEPSQKSHAFSEASGKKRNMSFEAA